MQCPKCKSEDVAHSHRKGPWEHFVSKFGVYPQRCSNCGLRFSRLDFEGLDMDRKTRRMGAAPVGWFYAFALLVFVALLYGVIVR